MKHSRINLSDPKQKKIYSQRTHEISNHFLKNHWKSKVNKPEVEKEEESVRKKSYEVDQNLNWKQNKFLCNSDFNKRVWK